MAWGTELAGDEYVVAFFTATIERRTGFVALTRDRLLFISQTARGPEAVFTRSRSLVRDAKIIGRGIAVGLVIVWRDGETLVEAADPSALRRLRDQLVGR